jgi:hypothetical protein
MMSIFSTVASGVASDLEELAAIGQIDEFRPLLERLETMATDLIRRAGGLSVEALRQQVGAAGNSGRTNEP